MNKLYLENSRSFKTVIKECELVLSSPETIVLLLKKRSDAFSRAISDYSWVEHLDFDEKTESSLLGLRQPLIDITLAQHCRYISTARELFNRSPKSSEIHLAVLSNRIARGMSRAPILDLFGSEESFFLWLADATGMELDALLENSTLLDNDFLSEILGNDRFWVLIDEDRQVYICLAMTRRLLEHQTDNRAFLAELGNKLRRISVLLEHQDAGPFCTRINETSPDSYFRLLNKTWGLASRAPVNDRWASALSYILEQLPTPIKLDHNPLDWEQRWANEHSDVQADTKPTDWKQRQTREDYRKVRIEILRLAIEHSKVTPEDLINSTDSSHREAAYIYAPLSVSQMTASYEKDGMTTFNSFIRNKNIWEKSGTREKLHEIAVSITTERDKQYLEKTGRSANELGNILSNIHRELISEYPNWFQEPEKLEEINTLGEKISPNFQSPWVKSFNRGVKKLEKYTAIFWISLGVVLGLLVSRF